MKRKFESFIPPVSKRRPGQSRKKLMQKLKRRVPNVRTGGFLAVEKKFVDNQLNATALATTLTVYGPTSGNCLTACAQGNGQNQRDGKTFNLVSFFLRGRVYIPSVEDAINPTTANWCRILLVWDKQTNAAGPTAANVLNGSGEVINQFQNLEFSSRFVILKDKKILLTPENTTNGANSFSTAGVERTFKFNLNFKKGLKINMNGTDATLNQVVDNSFHVLAVAESTAVRLVYSARMRFTG